MANRPTSMTPLQCAHWVLLWMFLMDMYNGQYLFWPVATETVILLLPKITGINNDLCVLGSLEMMSCAPYQSVQKFKCVNYTYCLLPRPISGYKMLKAMVIICTVLLIWQIAIFIKKLCKSKHILRSCLGSWYHTSYLTSIHAALSPSGTSPPYFTMKHCHCTPPRGVESIMVYISVWLQNGDSSWWGFWEEHQTSNSISMSPPDTWLQQN